jgi:hypothetical protein
MLWRLNSRQSRKADRATKQILGPTYLRFGQYSRVELGEFPRLKGWAFGELSAVDLRSPELWRQVRPTFEGCAARW